MLASLTTPPDNDRGPLYMEQALAAIHQANPGRCPLGFEIGPLGPFTTLFLRTPEELRAVVESYVYAHYPRCHVEWLPEEVERLPPGWGCWTQDLRVDPDLFPIRRHPDFADRLTRGVSDPVAALLTALEGDGEQLRPRIVLSARPAHPRRVARAKSCLRRLGSPFFRTHRRLARLYRGCALSPRALLRLAGWGLGQLARLPDAARGTRPGGGGAAGGGQEMQAAADKLEEHLFEVNVRLTVAAPNAWGRRARRKLREMEGAFGQFHAPRLAGFRAMRMRRLRGADSPARASSLLSAGELATLFHPPTLSVRVPELATVGSRELEPPPDLPTRAAHPGLAVLGLTAFRGRQRPFGLLPQDRRRHLAVLGKTGMGKSTLLQHLITADMRARRGVGFIDPHGDLVEALLEAVPRGRTNDVILFDAGDMAHPVSFNVLSCPHPEQRPLVASGVLAAFKKLHADSWGPRLEHILRNALLTLLDVPGTSLVSLQRLLSDVAYRRLIVGRVADPVVRSFWLHEFAGMPPRLQAEALSPVQNKVGHVVSSPVLRRLLGQSRGRIDLRAIMDEGQILLVNLSKGRIGEDASALLGSLLVAGLHTAALGRAAVPEDSRRDFYLSVDEFQTFATESFASILSEARKYRLNLTIANQYLAQVDEATVGAVFGNVGTLVAFQVGAQDASALAEQFGGDLTERDLMALPRHAAYVRLLIEGAPSRPFSMLTLPPSHPPSGTHRADAIRRGSRRRYARPVAQVDAEIRDAFAV